MNQNFWFIDFNAEEKRSITFNGQTFKFRPTGINTGIHEFTEQFAILNDQVTYPSIYILNPNHEIIFHCNQFLSANDLKLLLLNLLKLA